MANAYFEINCPNCKTLSGFDIEGVRIPSPSKVHCRRCGIIFSIVLLTPNLEWKVVGQRGDLEKLKPSGNEEISEVMM